MSASRKLRVGLYGSNGHQMQYLFDGHPLAEVVAVSQVAIPEGRASVPEYATLDELLADPNVDLVSLCSPRREHQAEDAIRCLRAGKHVYAEKPAVLRESDLDRVLAIARAEGRHFAEMGGSVLSHPYWAMRKIVASGIIGEVVQVIGQKSYPFYDGRPHEELIDGGLALQTGIHAIRFTEHVTGLPFKELILRETTLANRDRGDLRMAAGYLGELSNGALVSLVANYLNHRGTGSWGNDHLRVFGSHGMIESINNGEVTRLVVGDEDHGPISSDEPASDYFSYFANFILHGEPMPISFEEELHPLRVLLRVKSF